MNPNVEKGEYCIVLDFPASDPEPESQAAAALSPELKLAAKLLDGMNLRDACEELKTEGVKRNEIYKAKLRIEKLLEETE